MSEAFIAADVEDALSHVRESVLGMLSTSREMFFVELDGGRRVCTKLQGMHRLKFSSAAANVVFRVLLHHSFMCELRAPGTFDECMLRALGIVPANSFMKESIGLIPSLQDVRDLIEQSLSGTSCASMLEMVFDALELAGFNGRIIVERTPSTPHLERIDACAFKLKPAVELPMSLSFVDCRVICIDGHIETVAQAHGVFHQLVELGDPCALFVRELSDDVKHTIKVNFDRGLMRIVPFVVTFDLEGINTLVDVAVASGGDVVSKEQGQLISSLAVRDHPIVDRFEHDGTFAMISQRSARRAVLQHVERLRTKMVETNDVQRSFIEQRLRSLSSGAVRFRIVDGGDFALRSQLIDFALRIVKSALDFGIAHDEHGRVRLASAESAVDFYANNCSSMLRDFGAIIA